MGGGQSESIYLARIAALEAEVQALTVELAKYKALARSRANSRLIDRQPIPPIHVNADGTQGMRRGVSGRRPPASGVGEDKP